MDRTGERIVVGVDGSPTSATALRFAAAEALAHEAELVVLNVFEAVKPTNLPVDRPQVGDASDAYYGSLSSSSVLREGAVPGGGMQRAVEADRASRDWIDAAEEDARTLVADMLAELDERPEPVQMDLRRGVDPADALLEASRGARLLVVGSRGRGALRGLLLGSVSRQCAQQARVPVVVVPSA